MTTVAELTVLPVVEGSMAREIAKAVDALEDFDVDYETNAMGTVLESEDAAEVFRAARAAHEAVDGRRVFTDLRLDDEAERENAEQKVEAVERALGRPPVGKR